MTGRCVVISIILFRYCCHCELCIKAYLVLSSVLGHSGYLLVMIGGLAISCYCGPDSGPFLKKGNKFIGVLCHKCVYFVGILFHSCVK